MSNRKGVSLIIVILIFLLAISSGLNLYCYKEITTLKSKKDTLEQELKDSKKQINNEEKPDTGYFHSQPKKIEDMEMVEIENGQNHIKMYNTNQARTIEYFSYDDAGNQIDRFKKELNNNILKYTLEKVVPNLTEDSCHGDWTWCVTVEVTGGGCAFGGTDVTNAPTWFTEYLNALEYDKVFQQGN